MDIDSKVSKKIFALLEEGEEARRSGACSPYGGRTLEHCLSAYGWVKEDLRQALIKADPKYARSQGVGSEVK